MQVLEYNRANREVAILCNHQRTVPRAFQENWDKLVGREALLEKQIAELKEQLAQVRARRGTYRLGIIAWAGILTEII